MVGSKIDRALLVTGFGYKHDEAWATNFELFKIFTETSRVQIFSAFYCCYVAFSPSIQPLERWLTFYLKMLQNSLTGIPWSTCMQGVRRFGAAAVDFCHVAMGISEAFWEHNLRPWDTAAGVLVIISVMFTYKSLGTSLGMHSKFTFLTAGDLLFHLLF